MTSYTKEKIGDVSRDIHKKLHAQYIDTTVNNVLTKIWPKDIELIINNLSSEEKESNPEHRLTFYYSDINPKCPKDTKCVGFEPNMFNIIDDLNNAVKTKCKNELGVYCSFKQDSSYGGRHGSSLDRYTFKINLYDDKF